MKLLSSLLDLNEATKNKSRGTSVVDPWAAQMIKDSGLNIEPGPLMSDTGDGEFVTQKEAEAAIKALKAAGHRMLGSGSWTAISYKKSPKKGMTFDFDCCDDSGEVAVRFFDETVDDLHESAHNTEFSYRVLDKVGGHVQSSGTVTLPFENITWAQIHLDNTPAASKRFDFLRTILGGEFWGSSTITFHPSRVHLIGRDTPDLMTLSVEGLTYEKRGDIEREEHKYVVVEITPLGANSGDTPDRQRLIDRIEANAGDLLSVPYHLISTEDLVKILRAMTHD